MQKVVLVNENMTMIFKDTRKCRCLNIQRELVPDRWFDEPVYRDICTDCGCIVDYDAWMSGQESEHKVEEMIR